LILGIAKGRGHMILQQTRYWKGKKEQVRGANNGREDLKNAEEG